MVPSRARIASVTSSSISVKPRARRARHRDARLPVAAAALRIGLRRRSLSGCAPARRLGGGAVRRGRRWRRPDSVAASMVDAGWPAPSPRRRQAGTGGPPPARQRAARPRATRRAARPAGATRLSGRRAEAGLGAGVEFGRRSAAGRWMLRTRWGVIDSTTSLLSGYPGRLPNRRPSERQARPGPATGRRCCGRRSGSGRPAPGSRHPSAAAWWLAERVPMR